MRHGFISTEVLDTDNIVEQLTNCIVTLYDSSFLTRSEALSILSESTVVIGGKYAKHLLLSQNKKKKSSSEKHTILLVSEDGKEIEWDFQYVECPVLDTASLYMEFYPEEQTEVFVNGEVPIPSGTLVIILPHGDIVKLTIMENEYEPSESDLIEALEDIYDEDDDIFGEIEDDIDTYFYGSN